MKIKIHDRTFRPYILKEELDHHIDSVAEKINRDYAGCEIPPMLLCVLNGAMPFTAALMLRLNFECELQAIKVSSYEGIKSTGHLTTKLGPTAEVKGRNIILCEDLVDTGITVREVKKLLMEMGAADVKICSMLLKRGNLREQLVKEGLIADDAPKDAIEPFVPDYYGKDIDDEFIVGFGLDYNELGRCHKDIYVLDNQDQ